MYIWFMYVIHVHDLMGGDQHSICLNHPTWSFVMLQLFPAILMKIEYYIYPYDLDVQWPLTDLTLDLWPNDQLFDPQPLRHSHINQKKKKKEWSFLLGNLVFLISHQIMYERWKNRLLVFQGVLIWKSSDIHIFMLWF